MPDDRPVPRQSGRSRAGQSPSQQIELITQELKPQLVPDSVDWVFTLAEVAATVDVAVLRRCASDLAWAAREIGQRMPGDVDWQRCPDTPDPNLARLTLAYAHGFRLRQDFRFDELSTLTRRWLDAHPDEALLHALAAFAALGQGSDRAEPLLRRTSALPGFDATCRAVCLHGMWFGSHLPDQADRIVALSDEMIGRGEDDANLYYWRASALRRQGRFDDALASVDRAIALLPVGMNAVHQDYAREREAISAMRLVHAQVEELTAQLGERLQVQFVHHREEMRREVEQHSATARRVVSDSLLGIVEVLALFVTLAGFLIGSGALVLQAGGFWQSLTALALLTAGATGFFILLRVVVRFDRSVGGGSRPGPRRLLRLLRLGSAGGP